MKLSLAYGIPPTELKRRLTSSDVTLLIAADRLGLIPESTVETGLICATIANVNRDPKKGRPFTHEDFMLRVRRLKRQTAEQMEAGRQSRKRAYGGHR